MNPDHFPAARRVWLRILGLARSCAAAPGDDHAALALKHGLRGVGEAAFPLEAGDLRLSGVKAFLALSRLWLVGGAAVRTAFAASLAAVAGDLERLLIEQGAAQAQAHLRRQGLG